MAKVYPNYPVAVESPESSNSFPAYRKEEEAVMTVWRKSLLFNCKGFTVYDGKGNLVFRVDNYSTSGGETVLMDDYGKCLMTIRRKRLSLGENWLIYHGEESVKPRFSVKKHVSLLPSKGLVHVTSRGVGSRPSYSVVGSYLQRRCTVYDDLKRPVVEVRNKEAAAGIALGADVFRLVVRPGFNTSVAMALVIVLEQMFGP